jgi:hypothetical protein
MAIGTVDTWVSTCEQICSRALANLGVVGPGDTASGKPLADAKERLNALAKSIDADGQFLWRVSRLTTTTSASTAAVTISALAFAIDEPIRYTKSGATTAVTLTPMTRDEYMALPDRTITADVPSRYYIEKSLSTGRQVITLYLYPEPEDASDTVEYAAFLRAKDFETGGTHPDFPSSWTNCLEWGLTSLLASQYGQPALIGTFGKMFQGEKDRLINADNEQQGITFVPFGSHYYGGGW